MKFLRQTYKIINRLETSYKMKISTIKSQIMLKYLKKIQIQIKLYLTTKTRTSI